MILDFRLPKTEKKLKGTNKVIYKGLSVSKLQENTTIFTLQNECENDISKMSATLSWLQCVNKSKIVP